MAGQKRKRSQMEKMEENVKKEVPQELSNVNETKENTPEVKTPKANTPKANTPKVNTPKVNTPKATTPKVNTPKVNTPKATTPKVNTSEVNDSKANDSNTKEKKNKNRRKIRRTTNQTPVAATPPNSSNGETVGNPNAVYIQGISYDANEDMLRDLFKDCGEIVSINMPKYQDSGKPRGYAHIHFVSPEAVNEALKLDRVQHLGRYLEVQKTKERKTSSLVIKNSKKPAPVNCKTIFVKQLPYDVTEAEIRQKFMVFGKINEIRLSIWNSTQRQKGFCYIDYEKDNSAAIAVKKQQTIQIGGRQVIVDYETNLKRPAPANRIKPKSKLPRI